MIPRAFKIWLALAGVAGWLPLAACGGDFVFGTSGTNASVTGYTGAGGHVQIPAEFQGRPVTAIGDGAFSGCAQITQITVPEGVTAIGAQAFYYCAQLAAISLPESVVTIGDSAFAGCRSLPEVGLPARLTQLGDSVFAGCAILGRVTLGTNLSALGNYAFAQCAGLTNISLPASLQSLGESAFAGCASLEAVGLPDTLTRLGASAFASCSRLAQVHLPAALTTLSNNVFMECGALADITLPPGLTHLGSQAFWGCPQLARVALPETLESLGALAFANGSGLTQIRLPARLRTLGERAFANCSQLASLEVAAGNPYFLSAENVVFTADQATLVLCAPAKPGDYRVPGSVTAIGDRAFYACAQLQSITLGARVASLGTDAFALCSALARMDCDPANPFFHAKDGLLLDAAQTTLRLCPPGWEGPASVPASVTHLAAGAFVGCGRLTRLSLGSNVVQIVPNVYSRFTGLQAGAIFNCPRLERLEVDPANAQYHSAEGALLDAAQTTLLVCPAKKAGVFTLPATVTNLADGAFYGCGALAQIDLGARLTRIGGQTFGGCTQLVRLEFPAALAALGGFPFDGCVRLQGLYFNGPAPAMTGLLSHKTLAAGFASYYPGGASGWTSSFGGYPALEWVRQPFLFELGSDGTATITNYIGHEREVIVPAALEGHAVSGIAPQAFVQTPQITAVTLPDSLAEVGDFAFQNCTGLLRVAFGAGVARLGNYAFQGCTALEAVALPASVTQLGEGVFSGCAALARFEVAPANPAYASRDGVLYNAAQTQLIQCPAQRAGAFAVAAGVVEIGSEAFAGCLGLTAVTLPASVTRLGDWAFSGCLNLTQAAMGSGLESLGVGAFQGCRALARLVLPQRVRQIGNFAFSDCAALAAVCCAGPAPLAGGRDVFAGANQVLVYRLPRASGWGAEFCGRLTAQWSPSYEDWAQASGLNDRFPHACGPQDDADRDGLANAQELAAGTDPQDAHSRLQWESTAPAGSLSDADLTPVGPGQFAWYFPSVPGQSYTVWQSASCLGPWTPSTHLTARAPYTRVLLGQPLPAACFRLSLP